MGDRTWVEIKVPIQDLKKFLEITGLEGDCVETHDRHAYIFVEDANYALENELELASQAGCVFIGSHGAGDDYPQCVFACLGAGEYVTAISFDSYPIVRVCEDGNFFPHDLSCASNYWRIYHQVRHVFNHG